MVAELLVGYRRIVRRGLIRTCGDDWFETGCPAEVRGRILARQDAERGIDRFSAEAEDPFGYATFSDLADIVASTETVAGLLGSLAASPEKLCADLHALEELRARVSAARAVSEQEQIFLVEMHLRLREKLAEARRKARGHEQAAAAGAQQGRETSGRDVGEPATRLSEPPADETPVTASVPAPAGVEERSQPDVEPSAEVGSGSPERRPQETPPVTLEENADAVDGRRRAGPASPRPFDPVGVAALDGAPTPVGLVRVDRDDLVFLRELRREIIVAAEAAYDHAEGVEMSVWTSAWDSGWFSRKMEQYGLGEVATFYAVIEQYLERRVRGDDRVSTRTFLADREFAKLLLRLRELFLRLKV